MPKEILPTAKLLYIQGGYKRLNALYTIEKCWPSHRQQFLENAGTFIQQQLKTDHCCTGRF